eukprot:TRINITY_DN884_c0_g1_i10.p1 TRINITY_DN884_c0_g1~~TRINITY_DN884_c0_g1_i10.p1  ORF type:complete len:3006 (+),score=281.65 TRINITY_DN884_c0_g1_i10:8694-17711(+)
MNVARMPCKSMVTNSLLAILVLAIFITTCVAYTEVFAIGTDDSESSSYYVGNIDSNFFAAKRSADCSFEWTTSAGSATGDDDNDENREIFYDVVIGSDGLIYAVGTTKGNFSSPEDEVPTLDAAVIVYDPSDGSLVRQAQYDVENGLDDTAAAVVQKPDGTLVVAVYGSPPNVQNNAVYVTRILEISPDTLELVTSHVVQVQTSGSFASITGGPTILDMMYIEDQEAVVAVGQILGRGLLFMFSLSTGSVVTQAEWGNILGNMQIGGLSTDYNGAFFVTGSSSENVLENGDLLTVQRSEFHAYAIRYDNLLLAEPELTWVRQLAGSGGSQSGDDVALDPSTGAIVVIGSFDANFEVTDEQNGRTFELSTITSDGLTDIFVWHLDAENGAFLNLRLSSASTASEDRGNVVEVLSSGRLEIGGVINDGTDDSALACDTESLSPSPTPSSSSSAIASGPTSPGPSSIFVQLLSPSPSRVLPLNSVVITVTQQPLEIEVTPDSVPAQPSASPSTSVVQISMTPIVISSMTVSPNPSTSTLSSSATPSIQVSTRPLVSSSEGLGTISSMPSTAQPTISTSPSSEFGTNSAGPSTSVSPMPSISPPGGMETSSPLSSEGSSVSPTASSTFDLGIISIPPSQSTSLETSLSPSMSGLLSSTPLLSATLVLFISSTPTPSPSASEKEPTASSDVEETVSEAPSTLVPILPSATPSNLANVFSPVPSAAVSPNPSVTSLSIFASTSAMVNPTASFRGSISPSGSSHSTSPVPITSEPVIPDASATLVLLTSSTPTLSPSSSERQLISPSDEIISDVPNSTSFSEITSTSSAIPSGSLVAVSQIPRLSTVPIPDASATVVSLISSTPSSSPSMDERGLIAPSDVIDLVSNAPGLSATSPFSENPSDGTDMSSPEPGNTVPSPSMGFTSAARSVSATPSVTAAEDALVSPLTSISPNASRAAILNPSVTMVLFISSTPTPSPSGSDKDGIAPSDLMETTPGVPSVTLVLLPTSPAVSSTDPSDSIDIISLTPTASMLPSPSAFATIVQFISPTPSPSVSVIGKDAEAPFEVMETTSVAPSATTVFFETPSTSLLTEADTLEASPSKSTVSIPRASVGVTVLVSQTPIPSPSWRQGDLIAPSSVMEAIPEASALATPLIVSPSMFQVTELFSSTPGVDISVSPLLSFSNASDSVSATPSVGGSPAMSTAAPEGTVPTTVPTPIESAVMTVLPSTAQTPFPSVNERDAVAASNVLELSSEAPHATTLLSETPFVSSAYMEDSLNEITPVASTVPTLRPSATTAASASPTLSISLTPGNGDMIAATGVTETISDAPRTPVSFLETPFFTSGDLDDSLDVFTLGPSMLLTSRPSATIVIPVLSTPSSSPLLSIGDIVAPTNVMEFASEAPSTHMLSSETPLVSSEDSGDSLALVTPVASTLPTLRPSATMGRLMSSSPSVSPSQNIGNVVAPTDLMDITSEAPSTFVLLSETPIVSSEDFGNSLDLASPVPSTLPTPIASVTIVLLISSTPSISPSPGNGDIIVPTNVVEFTSEAPDTLVSPSETPLFTSRDLGDSLDVVTPVASTIPAPIPSTSMVMLMSSTPLVFPSSSIKDVTPSTDFMDTASEAPSTFLLFSETPQVSSARLEDSLDLFTPVASTLPSLRPSATIATLITLSPSVSPLPSIGDVVVPTDFVDIASEAPSIVVSLPETPSVSSADMDDSLDAATPVPITLLTPIAAVTTVLLISSTPSIPPSTGNGDIVIPTNVIEFASEAPSTHVLFSETPLVSSVDSEDSLDLFTPVASTLPTLGPSATIDTLITSSPSAPLSPSIEDVVKPTESMDSTSEAPSTFVLLSETPIMSSDDLDNSLGVITPVPSTLQTPMASVPTVLLISSAPLISPLAVILEPSNTMDISSTALNPLVLISETPFVSSGDVEESLDVITPVASTLLTTAASAEMVLLTSSTPSISTSLGNRGVVVPTDLMETVSETPGTSMLFSDVPAMSTNSPELSDTITLVPSTGILPTPAASATVTTSLSSSLRPSPLESRDAIAPSNAMETVSETRGIATSLVFEPSPVGVTVISPTAANVQISTTPSLGFSDTFEITSASPSARDLMTPFEVIELNSEGPSATPSSFDVPDASPTSSSILFDMTTLMPSASAFILPSLFVTTLPFQSITPASSPSPRDEVVMESVDPMEVTSETPSTTVLFSEVPSISSLNVLDQLDTVTPAPSASTTIPSASPVVSFIVPIPTPSPSGRSTNLVTPSADVESVLVSESELPQLHTLTAESTVFASETLVSPDPVLPISTPDFEDISQATPASVPATTPSGTEIEQVFSALAIPATPLFSSPRESNFDNFISKTPSPSVLVTPFATMESSEDVIPDDMQSAAPSQIANPMVSETTEVKNRISPEAGNTSLESSPGTELSDHITFATASLLPVAPSTSSSPDISSLDTSQVVATASTTSSPIPRTSASAAGSSSPRPSFVESNSPLEQTSSPSRGMVSSSFSPAAPSALMTPFAMNTVSIDVSDDNQRISPSLSMDPLITDIVELELTSQPQTSEQNPENTRGTISFESDSATTTPSAISVFSSPEASQAMFVLPTELVVPTPSNPSATVTPTPLRSAAESPLLGTSTAPSLSASPTGTTTSGFITATPTATVTSSATIGSSASVIMLPSISVLPVSSPSPENSGQEDRSSSMFTSPTASLEDNAVGTTTPFESFFLTPLPSSTLEAIQGETESPRATPVSALLLSSPFITQDVILPGVSVMITPQPIDPTHTQTLAVTEEPTLPVAVSTIDPSPDPIFPGPCPNQPPVVPDSSLLSRTNNFQRVRLSVQVAGPKLTSTCDLTDEVVQRFVNLSSLSTLSRRHLWFITSIEDGPPIFDDGSTLVVVEQELRAVESPNPYSTSSPEPADMLFPGSVIFKVTAFLTPFSVELIEGAYVDYVESQNIVRSLRRSGHNEIQWTGIVSDPVVIDKRRAPDVAVKSGVSGGYVAGIAFGTLLIIGAAVFLVAEAGWPV